MTRSHAEHDPAADVREKPRWCFRCRNYLPGFFQLMVEPVGSYYENWWRYRCDGCNEDHSYFPGTR